MSECKVCRKEHSRFVMNNKLVCFRCDELLFDVEIECDETELSKQSIQEPVKTSLQLVTGSKTQR